MGAIQTMDTIVNEVRRPVIFVKKLTQEELNELGNRSSSLTVRDVSEYSKSVQIYTTKDGALNLANTVAVDSDEEILCFNYDGFMTQWEQYRLSQLL